MNFTLGPSSTPRSRVCHLPDAHFARLVRESEDLRHARMLHSILHRPSEKHVGHFKDAERHQFYARTLAIRKRNSRTYKEFVRQKENLLLLQRLQQIHYYEHPTYSRSRVGKNYAKDWELHQHRHDAARKRLASRPRVGSSLIFNSSVRTSPLEPHHRSTWEYGRDGTNATKKAPWRDTTHMRDEEIMKEREEAKKIKRQATATTRRNRHTTPATLEGAVTYSAERASIEAELQRRWSTMPSMLDDPPYASDTLPSDPSSPYDDDFSGLNLGPDVEDDALAGWLAAHRNGGLLYPQPPSDIPTAQQGGGSTHRRTTVRARYIDEEEDDIDDGEEYIGSANPIESHGTNLPHPPTLSLTGGVAGARTGLTASASSLRTSLYDLAMHPDLGDGDERVQQFRLMQYAASMPFQPHPPHEPQHAHAGLSSFHPFDGVASFSSPHSAEIDDVLAVLHEFDDIDGTHPDGDGNPTHVRRAHMRQQRQPFYQQQRRPTDNMLRPHTAMQRTPSGESLPSAAASIAEYPSHSRHASASSAAPPLPHHRHVPHPPDSYAPSSSVRQL